MTSWTGPESLQHSQNVLPGHVWQQVADPDLADDDWALAVRRLQQRGHACGCREDAQLGGRIQQLRVDQRRIHGSGVRANGFCLQTIGNHQLGRVGMGTQAMGGIPMRKLD